MGVDAGAARFLMNSLTTDVLLIVAAFVLTAAHFYAEPLRWKAYLPPNHRWPVLRDLFFSTSLASYLLPFKLGIPIRAFLAVRVTGLSVTELGALMATDAMVTLSTWVALTLVVGGGGLLPQLPHFRTSWLLLAALVVVVLGVGLWQWSAKLRRALVTFLAALVRAPSKVLAALCVNTLDVLSYGLRHALIAVAIGLDPSRWAVWAALGIVATCSGILSGMPMGLVGYDAALMVSCTAAGATPAQAASILVINRALSLVAAGVLGVPAGHRMGISGGIVTMWRKFREMARAR
jgi:uncharacterized membrane protein YbhN (UPF0104 family)